MSKLDDTITNLVAGAMEFQNPKSVTAKGSLLAIGPKTAKQQIKDLILELFKEADYEAYTFVEKVNEL